MIPNPIAFFVREGQARWSLGDQEIITRPLDLLLVPEGKVHAADFLLSRHFRVIAVHFTARLFGTVDILTLLGFPVHFPDQRHLLPLMETLLRLSAFHPPGWERRGACLITELLLSLVHEYPERFCPAVAPHALKAFQVLYPALLFAERHLDGKVSVTAMAKVAKCSPTHLRRLFRHAFDLSPRQWVLERRLQRAVQFLRQSQGPVSRIASACGFESLSHFYRSFSRRFGESPAQFRRRIRGQL